MTRTNLKSLTAPLLLTGVLLILAGLAYFNFSPRVYRATTRLKITKIGLINDNLSASDGNDSRNVSVVLNEAKVIESDAVLDRVITNLDLSNLLRSSGATDQPPSQESLRQRLRFEIAMRQYPKSSVLELSVLSRDRAETAILANELAKVYMAYRLQANHSTMNDKFDAVRKQWDEANQQVALAQAKVDDFTQPTNTENAGSDFLTVGSDRYLVLQKKRTEMMASLSRKQSEMTALQAMDKQQLRLALASADPGTNSVLNSTLSKYRAAEKDLGRERIARGDDSIEVKHARLLMETLDSQLSRITDGILLMKQVDTPGIQAGLDQINAELKTAKTIPKVNLENTNYLAANEQLQIAFNRRDLLSHQVNEKATAAMVPILIKPELVEAAEIPLIPYQPDRHLAILIVATGATAVLFGLLAFLIGSGKKAAKLRP